MIGENFGDSPIFCADAYIRVDMCNDHFFLEQLQQGDQKCDRFRFIDIRAV